MALEVEVVYAASAQQQWIINVTLPADSSVQTAIEISGLLQKCPTIDLQQQAVGIFGRIVPLTTLVKTQDRIEIYRPLLFDPMLRRLQQVKAARAKHVKKT